ncbi:MAG: hypothetical protein N2167_00045 [Flavobacteriales bacterium]|nr:hypothetical protein [Flavobacteriales bacterium]
MRIFLSCIIYFLFIQCVSPVSLNHPVNTNPHVFGKHSVNRFTKFKKGDIYWGAFYLLGVNVPLLQWNSLDNFIKYHNHFYSSFLSAPLSESYSYRPSFIHGIEANIMVMTLNTLWTKTTTDLHAVYTNGDERIITVDFNTFQTGFDVELPISYFRIGVCNGITFNWGEFSSGYKYNQLGDDYVSYAQDVPMNGIYSTRRLARYMLGGRVGFTWKFVKFVAKAQYIFPGDKEKDYLIPLYDKLFSTTPGFGYYSDGEIPQYFNYAPENVNNLNQQTELISTPHGWFLTFQLGFGFTNVDNYKLKYLF